MQSYLKHALQKYRQLVSFLKRRELVYVVSKTVVKSMVEKYICRSSTVNGENFCLFLLFDVNFSYSKYLKNPLAL